MDAVSLPANIRQIGGISDGTRIYIEDYVCTYLFQYAEAGGYNERAALLVGRYIVIDGQPALFINGAIQGKYCEEHNGLLQFTAQMNAYADGIMAEYFPGLEIVGWMQSQPSYGLYLNQHYAAYHMREFTKHYQVLFVMDPLERINAFYAYNDDRSALAEAKGYFIYYDKNPGMHEYMLKNKASAEYKHQSPSYMNLTRAEYAESDEPGEPEDKDGAEEQDGGGQEAVTRPEDIIRRHQAERDRKRTRREQHKTMNLLVGLSAVLFIVCFVMGAGMARNQDRIAQMEEQLSQLSTAYRNLFVQLNAEGTASVFAAQNEDNDISAAAPEPAPSVTPVPAVPAAPPPPAPVSPAPAAPVTSAAPEPAPEPIDTTAALTIPETYTIQPGDSLIAISIRFYGDNNRVDDILVLNGIEDADKIIAGKTIALPRP